MADSTILSRLADAMKGNLGDAVVEYLNNELESVKEDAIDENKLDKAAFNAGRGKAFQDMIRVIKNAASTAALIAEQADSASADASATKS